MDWISMGLSFSLVLYLVLFWDAYNRLQMVRKLSCIRNCVRN